MKPDAPNPDTTKKVVIIGGGIAGLSAAVYARQSGYQVQVLEMNDMAGGLAMSWHKGPYTFETCLHWLYGSNPGSPMHAQWKEILDIEKLTFVDPEEFVRIESPDGKTLSIYADTDRLQQELLAKAPQDAAEIRRLLSGIRRLKKFRMPDPGASWAAGCRTKLCDAPYLPLIRRLSKITSREYGEKFKDPLLRAFFGEGEMGELSAIALLFSLAWMGARDAGYAVGGAQAVIRLIQQRLTELGGHIRFGARVQRILVKDGAAVGVQMVGGETVEADWVISAADGHTTLYDLLAGQYTSPATRRIYEEWKPFPSYIQVSLGVALNLKDQPSFVTRLLEQPVTVDPGNQVHHLSFRIFHFDPTFAPAGKTSVTCFLPTRNFQYWINLRETDLTAYRAEKKRVADAVISVLEKRLPQVRGAIETVDVSTPASVIRYTGNWKGSMEGWMLTPRTGLRNLPNTVPGLTHFLMVGQWVMPGGGLPSGPMTARPAVQAMCRHDRIGFKAHQRIVPNMQSHCGS